MRNLYPGGEPLAIELPVPPLTLGSREGSGRLCTWCCSSACSKNERAKVKGGQRVRKSAAYMHWKGVGVLKALGSGDSAGSGWKGRQPIDPGTVRKKGRI